MKPEVSIPLRYSTRWVETEPSGQECMVCGDRCFLFPPRVLLVTVNPGGIVLEMENVVCASCFDVAGMEE